MDCSQNVVICITTDQICHEANDNALALMLIHPDNINIYVSETGKGVQKINKLKVQ